MLRRPRKRMFGCMLLLGVLGCSPEQREEISKQVTQATEQVQKEVTKQVEQSGIQEKVNRVMARGEIALQIDAPIKSSSANCRILDLGTRGNVVQLRSYTDPAAIGYPAVFVQGMVDAVTVAELSGKSIEATLFVQASDQGTIWSTPLGSTVTVTFGLVEGNEIMGKIEGEVVDPSGNRMKCEGTLRGAFQPPAAENAQWKRGRDVELSSVNFELVSVMKGARS